MSRLQDPRPESSEVEREPASRPGWHDFVRRRPHLFALLLALRNRVSRLAHRRMSVAASVAASLFTVSGIAFAANLLGTQEIDRWITYIDDHVGWLLLLAGLQEAITVAKRRKQLNAELRDSWLAATPRAALTTRWTLLAGVLWVPLIQYVVVVALLLILRYAGQGDAAILRHIAASIGVGFIGGVLLGSFFSTPKGRADRPGSRYVPGKKSKASNSATASLAALSRWPIASAFAWATPDTIRWPLMAALLSVMGGSSILTGLGVVGFWMLMLYMATLCALTLRVANDAAHWLSSTPLSFRRFAIAIGVRSFVHQLLAAALVVAFQVVNGVAVFRAILTVTPWIAFVMVAYSTSIAYCFRMRRGARVSIALSAVSIAVVESLHRGAAVPLALGVVVWQLRSGARADIRQEAAHADP